MYLNKYFATVVFFVVLYLLLNSVEIYKGTHNFDNIGFFIILTILSIAVIRFYKLD
ncbi:hypothetical protein CLV84_2710 [Neolewinella xylanilytica]|uniref:Uncharacterized protein n=1 Tax=Neolewinella xylanilytica TaxID=1514080 RepID=A0A2S6I3R0_9BACT|nr:hypothetical protein CLV84_2710 [Neolewinella xylanilytica]